VTSGGAHDLVVVANRLPVQRGQARTDDWETSPGGLVRAMLSVLHHRRGAWVGWIGTPGDSPEPFENDDVRMASWYRGQSASFDRPS